MTILIVNADDFGYSEAVNYGIISAHKNGLVKSTTMMANMPGAKHGASLLNHYPDLACGVHLTLSCGRPLLTTHQTLVQPSGEFHKYITEEIAKTLDLEEVYAEFSAQIEKVKQFGVTISHFDSHHHVHTLKELEPVMRKLAKTYQVPIRGSLSYESRELLTVPLMDSFYKEAVSIQYFEEKLNEIKSYDIVDLMSHPAFLDAFLLENTSYAIDRVKEHQVLTSKAVRQLLDENEIQIGNYFDVRR